MNRKEILVLGGSGKTGRRIVDRLNKRGVPVRSGSRSGQPPFDWEDRRTWEPALGNIAAAYITYYPDLAFPGAAEAVASFANLAVACGIHRLVLLSGRGEAGARCGEQAIRDSGAEWTIIRSSFFCQNFSESFLAEGVISGELAFPAGDVGEPFVDVEDIADVAVAALTDERHAGRLYEVTGPKLLTFANAASEISAATGRTIRYTVVTSNEYEAALLANGLPEDFVKGLVSLFVTVLDGRNAYLSDGVQSALGREPRAFSSYARDAAAARVWNSPAVPM
jgi:uncharacterized protein YbjT (DUF2867 family)